MKPIGTVNTVATYDDNVDGCWAVDFTLNVPDSEDVTLIDESDWLVEEGEETVAVITPAFNNHGKCIELYNSGTTCHISPYKSNFSTYSVLNPPVFLNATNQQKFPAIGVGSLAIQALNGSAELTLTLSQSSPYACCWIHPGVPWHAGQEGLLHLYWWRDP